MRLQRPIVGVLSTASDFNPCHATAARSPKRSARGVRMAGGAAVRVPDHLAARGLLVPDLDAAAQPDGDGRRGDAAALPLDAVVLIGGCDKTIPAELMGAISADMPAIVLPVGADARRPP